MMQKQTGATPLSFRSGVNVFVVLISSAVLAVGCTPTTRTISEEEIVTHTPPEYYPCRDVPRGLAQADAIVAKLGAYTKTNEAAYWLKRQERLIARAYECKK